MSAICRRGSRSWYARREPTPATTAAMASTRTRSAVITCISAAAWNQVTNYYSVCVCAASFHPGVAHSVGVQRPAPHGRSPRSINSFCSFAVFVGFLGGIFQWNWAHCQWMGWRLIDFRRNALTWWFIKFLKWISGEIWRPFLLDLLDFFFSVEVTLIGSNLIDFSGKWLKVDGISWEFDAIGLDLLNFSTELTQIGSNLIDFSENDLKLIEFRGDLISLKGELINFNWIYWIFSTELTWIWLISAKI